MDTRIGGPVAWGTKHGVAARMPDILTDAESRVLAKFYRRQAKIQHCRICREQFAKVQIAIPIDSKNLKTRYQVCQLICKQHIAVSTRLHVRDPTGGFSSVEDWYDRYWRNPKATIFFLQDFWDDLFCLVFCIPTENDDDTKKRCRRIRRYLGSAAKVFRIMEHANNCNESTSEDRQLFKCHADLLGRYFGQPDRFRTALQYLRMLLLILSSEDMLATGMCAPWLSEALCAEVDLDAATNYYLFLLRYLPAIATHVEFVAGQKKGLEAAYNQSADEEQINPTGCR